MGLDLVDVGGLVLAVVALVLVAVLFFFTLKGRSTTAQVLATVGREVAATFTSPFLMEGSYRGVRFQAGLERAHAYGKARNEAVVRFTVRPGFPETEILAKGILGSTEVVHRLSGLPLLPLPQDFPYRVFSQDLAFAESWLDQQLRSVLLSREGLSLRLTPEGELLVLPVNQWGQQMWTEEKLRGALEMGSQAASLLDKQPV